MPTRELKGRLVFGLFEADLHSGELWKAGHRMKLPRQPFRVLAALLARPGDIVTRQELQQEIWGAETTVDFDQAIAAAINKIREALGDSAENPRFIQTLTKRGYRFIAPVTVVSLEPAYKDSEPLPQVLLDVKGLSSLSGAKDGVGEDVAATPHSAKVFAPTATLLSVGAPHPGTQELQAFARKWPYTRAWKRLAFSLLLLAALAGSALIGRVSFHPSSPSYPLHVDQITHYVPISVGPPNPESFLSLAMDGDRVLTSVLVDGRPQLSAIDLATGEVRAIPVPDDIASNSLTDISKDGSRLLLRSRQSTASEQPLWVVPSTGGSGRRIPGVLAHDATWMPDGASILYAAGNDLETIGPSEDSSHVYARLPGRAFWLRWSPDGELLRFTLFDPVTHAAALWELKSSDHTPRPVKLVGFEHSFTCCGVWLPEGGSYVFQAGDNLWELTGFGRSATTVQLTNGPLRSLSPLAARSGNRLFFIGLESPSGLQQFDPEQKEFRPAPAFLAEANRIDYSEDGKWVAWTDIHEKLWRARVDGSDKVRLTSDALEVFLAHWSPDAKRLAVMARKPGGVWQIYLVEANGDQTRVLLDEARNAADPGWSADSSSLVFGREPDLMGKESGPRSLQIIRLSTDHVEEIPNSENLFSPRWSPDGRWIVALTLDQKAIMLYDVAHRQWQRLAATSVADPVWSKDSKAIYIHAFLATREPILRIDVPSGAMHTVADLSDFHDRVAADYFFGGVTPEGEPLVQPRVGTGNLYSLDLTRTTPR